MQNIMAQDSKISHLLAILASFNKDLADLAVGTFHVPSTVINQEPIDLMPVAQRCFPAHALASYLSIPVTRTVREAAAVHG